MKQVLIYGDSILWSLNPEDAKRRPYELRVDTMLNNSLRDKYFIVCEGLRGRSLCGENGFFPEKDGLKQFGPILASHLPLDLIIIMLGTNDCNSKGPDNLRTVAESLSLYKDKVRELCNFMGYELPKIAVISPPDIESISLKAFAEIFKGGSDKIPLLADALKAKSAELGFNFYDGRSLCESVGQDGIHLSNGENKRLSNEISRIIVELLG
jgi:lysophospholipase L1-like esterase